jgi:abequosyltransferase
MPFISVCIPAYNRSEVLPELLDSILKQDYNDFEIVICEDKSPQRQKISEIVKNYSEKYPNKIFYFENEMNLGYDANIRNLFEKARGEFCFFMGNDDLMCEGAIGLVASTLKKHPNIGVLLRSYAAFDGTPENIVQEFRYFEKELFFPAGSETISTMYRRSVVIPGMVLHREESVKWSTDYFDGTLLYQLYLVANILVTKNAVFLPNIIVLYRNGGVPDFGNSEKEKGKFTPTEQTAESSVHFMEGMLNIALYVERKRNVAIYKPILKDISNYSYPILAIQSKKSRFVFTRYCYQLGRLGFWKSPMFYLYFGALVLLGHERVNAVIVQIKKRLGYTPTIGNVYKGKSA